MDGLPTGKNIDKLVVGMSEKAVQSFADVSKKVVNIFKLIKNVANGLTHLSDFLLAMVVLGACVLIMIAVYILWRVVRPRLFWISHSADFDNIMETVHKDIADTISLYKNIKPSFEKYTPLLTSTNFRALDTFVQYGKDIKPELDIYFKYYEIMRSSLDRWLYRGDFEMMAKPMGPTKRINIKRGEARVVNIMARYNILRWELRLLAKSMTRLQTNVYIANVTEEEYKNGKLQRPTQEGARALDFMTKCRNANMPYEEYKTLLGNLVKLQNGIRVMDMHLNTRFRDIEQLHDNRRFGFFNYLAQLIKPYISTILYRNIVVRWKELTGSVKDSYADFEEAWDRLGDIISGIPKAMRSMLGGKKMKKSSPDVEEDTTNQYGIEQKQDIVEGFGFLKGLISIGNFFGIIIDIAQALVELITDPLGSLFKIFGYIFGAIITMILTLLYIVWSIPPFHFIAFGIYFFVFKILFTIVISLFYVTIFLCICIIAVPLWVIDLLSGGLLRKITRCENTPFAWYQSPNYSEGNVYERQLFCKLPCHSHFKPHSLFCKRQDIREPTFCPQAQIYRIYKGLQTPSPLMMDKYNPDPTFFTKDADARNKIIKNFFTSKQRFLNKCTKAHGQEDEVVKGICANFDMHKLSTSDTAKIKALCKQVYCESNPKEGFCYKFEDAKKEQMDLSNLSDDLLRKNLRLATLVVTLTLVLVISVSAFTKTQVK